MRSIANALLLLIMFGWSGCSESKPTPPPTFYLQHPEPSNGTVFGVGKGSSFLEAKLKALDDIATQLNSRVQSITTLHKQGVGPTETDQHITVLTRKDIGNYEVVTEKRVDDTTYLLLQHHVHQGVAPK